MSRIESERLGPLVDAPASCVPFGRWSEPRKRTVVAVNGGARAPARALLSASSTFV
jgi:hypothetical protein